MHQREYNEYQTVKATGVPRPIISIEEAPIANTSATSDEDDDSQLRPDQIDHMPGRTSLIFRCNLFQFVSTEATSALCLVCRKNGKIRHVRGKTTTNYHLHMKVSANGNFTIETN